MTYNTHKDHDSSKNLTPIKQADNIFTVFHQNLFGLLNKREALLISLLSVSPRIICITEHHLVDEELESITLHPYTLAAKFCRRKHKCGDVCIFIRDNIHCTNINMDKYSNDKDIEICAAKLHILSRTIVIMTVYRSPTGNIEYNCIVLYCIVIELYFLNNLETALNQVYNNTVDIVLRGDFNINYLSDNQNQHALNSILTSYSLYSVIKFPTRIHNDSNTMIDNIFINKFKNDNYSVYLLINGLSDHDAQVLTVSDIILPDDRKEPYFIGKLVGFTKRFPD